ncbi:YeeE/YedE family protein [Acidisoma sp. S159]|uniref:YeeE/YedE family protein n=1 Tax=Acidisoma sp. S159 TaxID=1747225 RepID=UPI00131A91B8|nr:YeeE/YedE family protein [Acidisoma sp. S159]
MKTLSAACAGLLFGLGLAMSGMLDPARVLRFLDVDGTWDPRLAFVLGGAVTVSALGYSLSCKMKRPLFAQKFEITTNRRIDLKLLGGSALFGLGWGLAGFCPGPGIAALSISLEKPFIFVTAMLVGMWMYKQLEAYVPRRPRLVPRALEP